MARIVIFTGSPGSGKTSVANLIRRRAHGKRYRIVSMGTLMESEARRMRLISDRDQIRGLATRQIDLLRAHAFRQVARLSGKIILDMHASVASNGRYTPGMPERYMRTLKGLRAFIYIDADDGELIMRRINDKNRKRERETRSEISTHRLINLAMLAQRAADLNISLYILHNRQGKLVETAEKAMSVLDAVFEGKW